MPAHEREKLVAIGDGAVWSVASGVVISKAIGPVGPLLAAPPDVVPLMSFRRLLPLAVLSLPLLALAGCEHPTPAQRRLLDSMVGKTPVDVVRAFGVPTRTYTADAHSFLAYIDNETGYIPGTPGWGWGFGGYGWGGGFGGFGYGGYDGFGYGGGFGGFPPSSYSTSCQTTFEVTDDTVRAWTMRGDGC